MIKEVVYWGKKYVIEYQEEPVNHTDATKTCGDGIWLFNSETNKLVRYSLTIHDLPYFSTEKPWNPKGNYHLVTASSEPLWLWWRDGCEELQWGDDEIVLPKLKL